MQALWRVTGPDFDVDAFVSAHGLDEVFVWKQGDSYPAGSDIHLDNGFNLCIAEDPSEPGELDVLLEAILAFIEQHSDGFSEAAGMNIKQEISIGLSAASPGYVARFMNFTPDFMRALCRYNLTLEVFAYVCFKGGDGDDEAEGVEVGV